MPGFLMISKHRSCSFGALAFASAAHPEPEILIVDEALAVGDAEFQKKCLGKIGDVARQGRTIIFVSHHMNQIRRLCERALCIEEGHIREGGPTAIVTNRYEADATRARVSNEVASQGRAEFLRWEIEGAKARAGNELDRDGQIRLKFTARVDRSLKNIHHSLFMTKPSKSSGATASTASIRKSAYMSSPAPSRLCRLGPAWVSFYDNSEPIDDWDRAPPEPRTQCQDEFAGLLNIPSKFTMRCLSTESIVVP